MLDLVYRAAFLGPLHTGMQMIRRNIATLQRLVHCFYRPSAQSFPILNEPHYSRYPRLPTDLYMTEVVDDHFVSRFARMVWLYFPSELPIVTSAELVEQTAVEISQSFGRHCLEALHWEMEV